MVLSDEKRALLGDREAAKRLTDAGVLLPCPRCLGKSEFYVSDVTEKYPNSRFWIGIVCTECKLKSVSEKYLVEIGKNKNGDFEIKHDERPIARLDWNTRAKILEKILNERTLKEMLDEHLFDGD